MPTYIIAQNPLSITVPEGFRPWQAISRRFLPFLSPETNREEPNREEPRPRGSNIPNSKFQIPNSKFPPGLSIRISQTNLTNDADGVSIYEPEYLGIGIIAARASRLYDGTLVMEFLHVNDGTLRLRMKMPPSMDTAEIEMREETDNEDSLFLAHAIMLAYLFANVGNGTMLIHSSCILYDGKAYLFQGKSGTGKSTHARMWLESIPGAELLNDDHPVVRFAEDGTAMVYGSPWSGKTHCYKNISAPIGAFVRIVRAKENELKRLMPLQGYASLTTSVFYLPIFNEEQKDERHKVIERLAMTVPCCEMHCLPDPSAANTCLTSLQELKK